MQDEVVAGFVADSWFGGLSEGNSGRSTWARSWVHVREHPISRFTNMGPFSPPVNSRLKPWVAFLWRSTALSATVLSLYAVPPTTHYVTPGSLDPTPPYTSWATGATNIQDAVDVSEAGD